MEIYSQVFYFYRLLLFVFQNGKTPKSDGVKTNNISIDLLSVLPKAPRVATEFPASWDWNIFYESPDKDKLADKSKVKSTPIEVSFFLKLFGNC